MNALVLLLIACFARSEESYVIKEGKFEEGWHINSTDGNVGIVKINGLEYINGSIKESIQFVNDFTTDVKKYTTLQFYMVFESKDNAPVTFKLDVEDVTYQDGVEFIANVTNTFIGISGVENKVTIPITVNSTQKITLSLNDPDSNDDLTVSVREVKLSTSNEFVSVDIELSINTEESTIKSVEKSVVKSVEESVIKSVESVVKSIEISIEESKEESVVKSIAKSEEENSKEPSTSVEPCEKVHFEPITFVCTSGVTGVALVAFLGVLALL
ncbi:hypothetical protein EIN_184510 [Entamoeba invadens IP1]|uniref:hypothetical protein n=1 Tax=Entamoeba invadens IP1 TaxID=370355 RepID=UPI0002C3E414|nr:hypothetical protein EIN_184510 [Entamoeba invadens IP1]ELP94094.1 hypothetical protein EIN_184510 [Entamoeba invadens IP1]|eukprot:XP_004260865.1 hypothetical protein EIN_184510 [Entamoeba invadens IP1]